MLVHLGHSCPVCGAEAICPPYRLYGVRGKSGCETEWSRLVKGLDQLVAPELATFQLGQAFECERRSSRRRRRRRSLYGWQ